MDPTDPYRMMMLLGHAHFRFRFLSRSNVFWFSQISPRRFTIFLKFHRRLVGLGCVKILGINQGICPPLGARLPDRNFTFRGRNFFGMNDFRLTSLIDRGQCRLRCCKISKNLTTSFRENGDWKFCKRGTFSGSPTCSAPWRNVLMPFVRRRWTVKNAVDLLSISTSGPELRQFEVCRIVSPSGVNCHETLRHKCHQRSDLVDLGP